MHSSYTASGAHAFMSESAKVNTSWPEVRGVTVPGKNEDGVAMDVYIGAAGTIEELFSGGNIHFKCTAHQGDQETLMIPTKEAAQAIKLLVDRNRKLAKAGSKKEAIEPALAEAVANVLH